MLAGMELLSVIARLSLAALFGGLLGLERERKNRPAGLRTYLIVCVGAALTVLLSEYEQWMLSTHWAAAAGRSIFPGWARRSLTGSASWARERSWSAAGKRSGD
mgnify:CR=1 FL=1